MVEVYKHLYIIYNLFAHSASINWPYCFHISRNLKNFSYFFHVLRFRFRGWTMEGVGTEKKAKKYRQNTENSSGRKSRRYHFLFNKYYRSVFLLLRSFTSLVLELCSFHFCIFSLGLFISANDVLSNYRDRTGAPVLAKEPDNMVPPTRSPIHFGWRHSRWCSF